MVVCCTTLHRYLQKESLSLISFCDIFYVIAVLGSDQQFLLALKNGLAKSVHLDDKLIKFDEVGVKAFAARMPDILRQAGFKGIMLEILASFCSGLEVVYQNLLQTPHQLTGEEYEVKARVHLGFQAVQIFGTVNITASIKQIVSMFHSMLTRP